MTSLVSLGNTQVSLASCFCRGGTQQREQSSYTRDKMCERLGIRIELVSIDETYHQRFIVEELLFDVRVRLNDASLSGFFEELTNHISLFRDQLFDTLADTTTIAVELERSRGNDAGMRPVAAIKVLIVAAQKHAHLVAKRGGAAWIENRPVKLVIRCIQRGDDKIFPGGEVRKHGRFAEATCFRKRSDRQRRESRRSGYRHCRRHDAFARSVSCGNPLIDPHRRRANGFGLGSGHSLILARHHAH